VPPEITSPCTGLPRKMILLSSLYVFGPDLFQALHGASMRHSLNLLAVQVNVWSGPSSARLGRVAPINNVNAVNLLACRGITVSDEVDGSENNECAAFRRPQGRSKIPHTGRFAPALTQQRPLVPLASRRYSASGLATLPRDPTDRVAGAKLEDRASGDAEDWLQTNAAATAGDR
jgi:hypothetical protein